jgi:hypothetical protein
MSNYRIILETVELSDKDAVKAIQKKLNQWKTQGLMLKFTTVNAGTHVLFTIALRIKAKVETISMPSTPEELIEEFNQAEADASPF